MEERQDAYSQVVLFLLMHPELPRPNIGASALRLLTCVVTKSVAGLQKYSDQGVTIVVCESSYASALSGDLPDLIGDKVLGVKLGANVMMIDQFLEREISEVRLDTTFESYIGSLFQKVSFNK